MSSADDTVEILLLLSTEPRRFGVREIGRRLDMSASTAHRLLRSLVSHGLAQQVDGDRKYRLGWACFQLANALKAEGGVAQAAPSIAYSLRDQTQETVAVQVRAGTDRLCIFEAEGLHQIRRRVGVGSRTPLHAGASGQVLLAYLPEGEIENYLSEPLQRVASGTVTNRRILRDLLLDIRRKGFVTSRGQSVEGVAAIAVPVFNEDGRVEASISVSGPDTRLAAEVIEGLVPQVVRAGETMSRELGYLSTDPTSNNRAVTSVVQRAREWSA